MACFKSIILNIEFFQINVEWKKRFDTYVYIVNWLKKWIYLIVPFVGTSGDDDEDDGDDESDDSQHQADEHGEVVRTQRRWGSLGLGYCPCEVMTRNSQTLTIERDQR